jgi:hypothetical protein
MFCYLSALTSSLLNLYFLEHEQFLFLYAMYVLIIILILFNNDIHFFHDIKW